MPQPERKVRCRPVTWRGEIAPECRPISEWYAEELRACGALIDDQTARYVTCLPEEESRGEP